MSQQRKPTSVADKPKPNVVLVLADDLGWADLGAYGNTFHETPHLDRLASDGTRFTRWHACPNCAPTRAAMLTGQYGERTGVYTVGSIERFNWRSRPLRPVDNTTQLPLDRRTIADVMRSAGYVTGMFGKWHLGDNDAHHPARRGFDEAVTVSTDNHFQFTTNPPRPIPPGIYQSDYLTDLGIDFVKRHAERPFFLYLPLTAVHAPWDAPEKDVRKYEAKSKRTSKGNPVYAAMVEAVDRSVGRLRAALKETGVHERTVFLFLSDNGGIAGYRRAGIEAREVTDNGPLKGGKGMLSEGGIRVPFLACWPGVTKPGTVCQTPGIHVDLLPTLAEISGGRRPKQALDGVSVVPELRNPKVKRAPRPLFQHFPGYLGGGNENNWRAKPAGCIEFNGWKLVEWFEDGRLELYHLDTDPGEQRNLAQERPSIAADLLRRMRDWRKEVGARIPQPNTEPPSASPNANPDPESGSPPRKGRRKREPPTS